MLVKINFYKKEKPTQAEIDCKNSIEHIQLRREAKGGQKPCLTNLPTVPNRSLN